MSAIQVLLDEHRVIEQVLACLSAMARQTQREGRLEVGPAREALEFFRQFADRCHHGKEEAQLFPMLETRGFSATEGPTACMRHEHVQGRALLAAIDAAIEGAAAARPEALDAFVRAAQGYAQFLQEHIDKEDQVLFPMAERTLKAADMEALDRSFERVEREEIGAGVHESWVVRANALADRFGVARAKVGSTSCGCGGHA
jgi:hemerythrin-like domain-containing protein